MEQIEGSALASSYIIVCMKNKRKPHVTRSMPHGAFFDVRNPCLSPVLLAILCNQW